MSDPVYKKYLCRACTGISRRIVGADNQFTCMCGGMMDEIDGDHPAHKQEHLNRASQIRGEIMAGKRCCHRKHAAGETDCDAHVRQPKRAMRAPAD